MIPMPMNEIDEMARMTSAATKFASGIERLKKSAQTPNRKTARMSP